MSLTDEGKELVGKILKVSCENYLGLMQMEQDLKEVLNIKKVLIVPGNSDELPWVKNELR